MRLFAAIVPPRAVLEEVMSVVQAARPSEPEPESTRRFLRWSTPRGARAAARSVTTAPDRQLDQPRLDRMYIPITSFGNVTLGDSVKLASALRSDVASWSRPVVSFSGGTALEFKGDESVWAKLQGDLDSLVTIGRGVPLVVQRLGYFVDRRQFRPWLSVGTITEETTVPYLQSVVDALEGLHGRAWTVESVSLMVRPPESVSPDDFEVKEEMPLAGS